MDTFVYKFLGLYVYLRFNRIPPEIRYFYKATYFCRYVQLRYFVRDYVTKKQYKTITWSGEFGAELLFALPFAYWHYKNGTLKKTSSSKFTKELYFFSPDHEEIFNFRTNKENHNYEFPRVLYSHNYNMSKWLQVPLKSYYSNDIYLYEKPILIVANRYNMEWGQQPISYLTIPTLDFIIEKLKTKFTIIYNRPKPQNIVNDDSQVYDLNEFKWLKKEHPEVLLMEDLFEENRCNANNFNHFQLAVYANANHFISTHGGTATLASYFGGINIIFSKEGPEYQFGCYEKLFPKLSGTIIKPARSEEQLKLYIEEHLVN